MSRKTIQFNGLSAFVISVVAYYVAGLIGLELAIPPGFASAVWPASGAALALMIMHPSKWVVFGAFTASFLLNLQHISANVSVLDWPLTIIPFFIGIGAALQLSVGYFLFKYLLAKKNTLGVADTIVRFSLIVAPLSCLISASVGTSALILNEVIPSDFFAFSWFTWWLGDSIGVLLFTPMLLIIFATKSQFQFSRKLEVVVPSILIFTFACLLFFWSVENSRHNMDRELDDKADHYTQRIEEDLKIAIKTVQSYQALFQGSDYISFKEFEAYSTKLLEDDNTLYGVGWTEVIDHIDRTKTEIEMRVQGYKNFSFKQPVNKEMVRVPDKNKYYPVLYIYPYARNKLALGLDLSVLPGRLDLLKKIEVTGKGRVTKPITLVQAREDEKSFIMYMPVWRKYPNDEVLRGYVSGVFRAGSVFDEIIDDAENNNIALSIKDVTQKNNPEILIKNTLTPYAYLSDKTKFIKFLSRTYQIGFSPSAQYKANEKDWISWVILICGFLISALLQAFILMMSGAIEHTNKMVKLKTRQLTEAIEKAESANKAKSMFLANMNHELRTPLNAIIGLVNLCMKTPLTDKQSEYLSQSKLATHTLMSLINQSLDYAKIESGKLELECLEFDLAKVIQKMYAVFNTQAQQKGIKFILSINDDVPRYFMGDALRLEQVLLNMCSNALKFTETGSVSLDVTAKFKSETMHDITIKIKDSGIGISKEQQATLFQSFHQADNTTTRKYGGTGLGLAISKQLIELMSGGININSEIGEGCEFVITIPLINSPQTVTFNSESIINVHDDVDSLAELEQNSSLEGVNILLVEDIEINRMIAMELLENHGANVTLAFDGQQALEVLASTEKFDVVLMDIQMPVMDGFEATKALRMLPQFDDLPVLAMTANAMNEDIQRCEAAGMDGHIPKPIDEGYMVTSILTALSQPRA